MAQSGTPKTPGERAEAARQLLARAALLRRQAQQLQYQHDTLKRNRTGQARPPYLGGRLDQLAAERDAKRGEAARLEQEAEQMLR